MQLAQADYPERMSYLDAVARVAQLQELLGQAVTPSSHQVSSGGGFEAALDVASIPKSGPPRPLGSGGGLRALQDAAGELGVTEQPPGSNDGPRIADYRSAVAGSYAGAPWCAYFVSWAAAQAGVPIGEGGRGLGSVEGIAAWAGGAGRLVSDPQPGDLILFGGRHVGIVERVNPDGTIATIEGNSADGVHRRTHPAGEATGFVRL